MPSTKYWKICSLSVGTIMTDLPVKVRVTYSVLDEHCGWSVQAGSRPVRCTLWSWSLTHVERTILSQEHCHLDPAPSTPQTYSVSVNVLHHMAEKKKINYANRHQTIISLPVTLKNNVLTESTFNKEFLVTPNFRSKLILNSSKLNSL